MDNAAMIKAQSTAIVGRKEIRFETQYSLAAATITFMC